MEEKQPTVYPHIPNSVPSVKEQLVQEVGVESTEDFYEDAPENLRLRGNMNLSDLLPAWRSANISPRQNAGASLLSCPVVGIRAERKHSVTPELTHLENWCMI